MVARNFFEVDANILYPRVDMAGEKSGITGMEFPLLNYLIYLVSLIGGFHHWTGRLINLIISSAGIYYFYLLIKKYFTKEGAFYATLLLLASIWFIYSRKIMPDTFSAALVLMALWYGLKAFEKTTFKNLTLYIVLASMGMLSKIPAAIILSPMLIGLLSGKYCLKNKLITASLSAIPLLLCVTWYFYWVPYLVNKYEYWHFFMGVDLKTGLHEISKHWILASENFWFNAFMSFSGFGLSLFGLIISIIKKQKLLLITTLVITMAYIPIIISGGYTFARHSYYIIPFVPLMALIASNGIMAFHGQWPRTLIIIIVLTECILNQQHDFRLKESRKHLLSLEAIADKHTPKESLIAINGGESPIDIYFSHRKGWTMETAKLSDTLFLNTLRSKGCQYLFINKNMLEGPMPQFHYPLIYDGSVYSIFKLEENK